MDWRHFELDDATVEAIESLRPVLSATEQQAEEERTLPMQAVEALRDAGLFNVALPREVGGVEATPVFEFEVYEAVSRISTVAGWTLFVGNLHTAIPTVYSGEEAFQAMWGDGRTALVAGQYAPMGVGERVDGGLRVSGHYSFGSGISHANWVLSGCRVGDEMLGFVTPVEDVQLLDNWFVAGLAGTGSRDYELQDVLVPDGYWWDWMEPQSQRGGARYATHIRSQIAACHSGFALGAGERALDEVISLAATKKRMLQKATIADRGVFQYDIGRARAQLEAGRAYAVDVLSELAALQASGDALPEGFLDRIHAMATYATELAVEVSLLAYRHGGGSALRLDSPIQRTLRDVLAAQQHLYVADLNYEAFGGQLIATSAEASLPA